MAEELRDTRKPFHENILPDLVKALEDCNVLLTSHLVCSVMKTKIPAEHQEAIFEGVDVAIAWLKKEEVVDEAITAASTMLEFLRSLPAEKTAPSSDDTGIPAE